MLPGAGKPETQQICVIAFFNASSRSAYSVKGGIVKYNDFSVCREAYIQLDSVARLRSGGKCGE